MNEPQVKLRVVIDKPRIPEFNMAADQYLLNTSSGYEITLRIYRWFYPTITIGYMQSQQKLLNLKLMKKKHIRWIKRVTGGRAVLHDGDITYSIIFSEKHKSMGKTVSETYSLISRCLMSGLRTAGIESSAHDSFIKTSRIKKEAGLPCFLSPNRDEIMVDGKKLVGSAQKRTSKGVLQHGSIPVTGAFRDLPFYQNISERASGIQIRLLKQKCVCVNEVVPGLSVDRLTDSLVKGFTETLNIDHEKRGWTEKETREIGNNMENRMI